MTLEVHLVHKPASLCWPAKTLVRAPTLSDLGRVVPALLRKCSPRATIRTLDTLDLECSRIALRGDHLVAYCLVTQERGLPCIADCESAMRSDFKRIVRETLIALWGRGDLCVLARPTTKQSLELFRSCGFAEESLLDLSPWVATANVLRNQGRADQIPSLVRRGIGDNPPPGLQFQLDESPSRLYWRKLPYRQDGKSIDGRVIRSRIQTATAVPLLYECFGDGWDFLHRYLQDPLLSCSVIKIEAQGVSGVCLVGEAPAPCISAIAVSPLLRARGLARSLLLHSLKRLTRQGYCVVRAHIKESNLASHALFTGLGFQRVESIRDLVSLGRCTGLVHSSDLNALDLAREFSQEALQEAGLQVRSGHNRWPKRSPEKLIKSIQLLPDHLKGPLLERWSDCHGETEKDQFMREILFFSGPGPLDQTPSQSQPIPEKSRLQKETSRNGSPGRLS